MKRTIAIAVAGLLLAGCAVNRYRSDFEFANKLASEGLWQEAYYRWQKAVSSGGGSAALHNNLAVALEALGRVAEAQREYEQAMKLAPGNTRIQSNYNLFMKNQRKDSDEKKDAHEKK